jgi:perosamine synthetase
VSGRSAWSSEISEFCKTEGIVIIEDAAEAFGSRDPETGKMLGTIGELGAYSFSPNKIITTGQGGAVVSNKAKYLDTLHALKDQGRPTRGTGGPDLHPFEGYNFKLTNLQAAVGLAQLEQYENRRRHLARVYHEYKSRIQTCPHLKLLNFNLEKGEVPLWPDLFVINREELISSLRENHIGYREIWLPIHTQKKYLHSSKDFPNAVLASAHIVWLPSAFSLNKYMIEKIVRNLNCRMCHSG